MKQINDPEFGVLEYDKSKKAWTKRIPLGIWFGDDYQLDLVVKCDEDEEITDKQRESYKSYLANLSNYSSEVYKVLCSYHKDHYEEFNRRWNLPDELKIEEVNPKETIAFFDPLQLFIDRNGNYGWLSSYISDRYLISVILSDGKPRIFQSWNVLRYDYAGVDDDVFGEMYFDQGWCKWFKTDINGTDGQWVMMEAHSAFRSSKISPEQKANYQKYIKNEKSFMEEYPKVLLEYYKKNYGTIADIWDDADLFNPDDMDENSIKDLVEFNKLYFNDNGRCYGWLCECAWDEVYGLSIYYDNTKEGICIGSIDSLVI